jgi:hypothetical protein
VFLAPYLGVVPFSVLGYGVQASVLLLALEAGWALLAWASRRPPSLRVARDPLAVLIAAYLCVAVLSGVGLVYAAHPEWAGQTHPEKFLRGLLSRAVLVVTFLRIRAAAQRWGTRPLIGAYVLSSAMHALYGIYQYAALTAGLPGAFPPMNNPTFTAVILANLPSPRAFGLTPEPSMLAYTLVPAWAYLAARFIGAERLRRSEMLGLFVISIALLLTWSRAGLLACALALAGLMVTRRGLSHRAVLAAGAAFAIFLGAILGGAPEGLSRLFTQDPSLLERLASKRVAVRIGLEHPWSGAGLGSYPLLAPVYLDPERDEVFDPAGLRAGRRHLFPNDALLEAFAEMGLAGALVILSFPLLALAALRRGALRAGRGTDLRPVAAGVLGAISSALFSGFIFVSMWIWFGLLSAAMLRARTPDAVDEGTRARSIPALRLHRRPL